MRRQAALRLAGIQHKARAFVAGSHAQRAAGRHPLHVARRNHATLVAIVNGAVENERHGFESGVRMRPAHRTFADIQMVIGEHDERIVEGKWLRRHDLRREVTGTNKSSGRATTLTGVQHQPLG